MEHTPLGRAVPYPDRYQPELLVALERAANRAQLSLPTQWHGADRWNAWELSWLNMKGKPQVATGSFIVPHDSPRLIESKSLKLYLNSFNQERLPSLLAFQERVQADLSAAAGSAVSVYVRALRDCPPAVLNHPQGVCLDDLDIEIRHYQPQAGLLGCRGQGPELSEVLYSDLLKSNCPVTGQPDWGSVQISYTGPAIDHAGLLAYIVSLRQHTEFHEHCVEKMFCDIWQSCRPQRLAVSAAYLRRGGLDINPWRASHAQAVPLARTPRQ